MKTIWKYPIPIEDKFVLTMPIGAQPLCVQVQHGQPCIWALIDTSKPQTTFLFRLSTTGYTDLDDNLTKLDYLGTFQMNGGDLVFHVFQT